MDLQPVRWSDADERDGRSRSGSSASGAAATYPLERLGDAHGHVFAFLSYVQLLEVSRVCKRWKKVVDGAPHLWLRVLDVPQSVYFADLKHVLPAAERDAVHAKARLGVDPLSLSAIATPTPTRAAVLRWFFLHSLRELSLLARRRGVFLGAAGAGADDAYGERRATHEELLRHQHNTVTTRVMSALLVLLCAVLFVAGLVVRSDFPQMLSPAHVPSLPMCVVPLVFGSFAWFLANHYWLHMQMLDPRAVLYGTMERLNVAGGGGGGSGGGAARWSRVLNWNWLLSTLQLGPFVSSFWLLIQWRHDYDFARSATATVGGAATTTARSAAVIAAASTTLRWSYVSIATPVIASLLGHALLFALITPGAFWATRFTRDAYELIARNVFWVTEPFAERRGSTRCIVWSSSCALTAWFVYLLAAASDFVSVETYGPLASGAGDASLHGGPTGWVGVFAPLLWLQLVYWYAFVCRCRCGAVDDHDDSDADVDAYLGPGAGYGAGRRLQRAPFGAAGHALDGGDTVDPDGEDDTRTNDPLAWAGTLHHPGRHGDHGQLQANRLISWAFGYSDVRGRRPSRGSEARRKKRCTDSLSAALLLVNSALWLALIIAQLKTRFCTMWLSAALLGLAFTIPSGIVYGVMTTRY